MEGFAEMIREELTATSPPRKVVFRDLSDSWGTWAVVAVCLVNAIFLSYFAAKCMAFDLAPQFGDPLTAQITSHSTGIGKRGRAYYLQVTFADQQGKLRSAEMRVSRRGFEANPDGATLSIHVLSGFPQWPVWDQEPPNPRLIYGSALLALMVLFFLFFPTNLFFQEFRLFRKGIFVKGTIVDIKESGQRGNKEVIKVEYILDGKMREKTITRSDSDDSLEDEVAVVVMPGDPDNARIFFNDSDGTLFQVRVPISYYNQ